MTKYLFVFLVVILTSCATRFVSKNKVLKQEKNIEAIAAYLARNKIEELDLDTFPDAKIKYQIKKIKITHANYYNDSTGEFMRLSGFYNRGIMSSRPGRYVNIIYNI